jgi:glutathione S-transferase
MSSDAGAETAAGCEACNDLAGERRATMAASADQHPDIGDIAVVTALSWIEFRRVYDFLSGRPRLARWYSSLCARPSMLATKLEGQTHD